MGWIREGPRKHRRLARSVEIDASVERVFAHWTRFEKLPQILANVRRVKRIDARRLLWDVDLAGRQTVWEACIFEIVPDKLIRWESTWGARNRGQVRFEELSDQRALLRVEIEFLPDGPIERLGAGLGLVDVHVARDLDRFRAFVERLPRGENAG